MASVVLASRNEPYWGERKVYMRKGPSKGSFDPPNKSISGPADASRQEELPAGADSDRLRPDLDRAASDDSSLHNRKSISLNRKESVPSVVPIVAASFSHDAYLTFNVGACSKQELKKLKKRLISELEQVRSLSNRIEARELQSRSGYSASQFSGSFGGKEVTSGMSAAAGRLLAPLNISSLDSPNTFVGSDGLKEKRTPKANQYYRASEFVMGKEKMPPPENKKVLGSKRPPPLAKMDTATGRDLKRQDSIAGKLLADITKRCGQILTKLMKHKYGWGV